MKWRTSILFALSLSLMLLFTACGSKEMQKWEESRFLFGTYIKITVYSERKKQAQKAMEKAFEEIERIDKKYNSKREESLVYALNHRIVDSITLDEEGQYLFQQVLEAYRFSHRKYDISIAPLLKVWGFEKESVEALPNPKDLAEAMAKVNFDKLHWEGDKLALEKPVEEIDTGSFLKGYALARAKVVMEEEGIKSAFITSISSIDLIGSKPEEKPWRIALEDPDNPQEILGVLSLKDKALGVSGDYQTYVEIDGERYHHILDKETGYPVMDKKMVVVISEDGFEADLYSTTFFLMPIEEVLHYVNSRESMEVLIVDANREFHMSQGFAQYFSKK